MARVYLKRFMSDPNLYLPLPQDHPGGEAGYEKDKKLIRAVEKEEKRFSPLVLEIHDALNRAKPVVGDPSIPVVFWVLSTRPKPEPYFKPEPYLYVDVSFDPKKLLTLEKDKEVIGELGISLVEEALSKLGKVADFPIGLIREACSTFRANDYTYVLKSGEALIPGTKVKGRIDLLVNGAGTKRIFTAIYRKRVLFEQQISEIDWPELSISSRFNGFLLEGDLVHVLPDPYHIEALDPKQRLPDGSAEIDLKQYPETYDLMRANGWV